MKKVLLSLLVLICFTGVSNAKSIDRKIVRNATVAEVEKSVLGTIELYEGLITKRTIDKEKHNFVVDYNGTTMLGHIGWSKQTTYPKAMFSCNLKQQGNNVLITNRKVKYSGFFNRQEVFNHYKKVYEELKAQGFDIE